MAIFDKKPLLIDGRIIFSPKDLSSGEKFALLFIKLSQMLLVFAAVGGLAGVIANMLRITFDFPWSWGVFLLWAVVAGLISIASIALEFFSWWLITDEEAQSFRDYYDNMAKRTEGFMKDNGVDYIPEQPIQSTTTTKDDDVKDDNKVIPITTIRKQPHDDEEKE